MIVNHNISRLWAYLFAAVALVTVTLLAVSLSRLNMDPGLPLPIAQLLPRGLTSGGTTEISRGLISALRISIIITWLLLPFCVVYLLLSKKARARLLRDLVMVLPVIFMLYFITNLMMNNKTAQEIADRLNNSGTVNQGSLHLPEFTPPQPWVTNATTLMVALAFAALIAWAAALIWQRKKREAQDALAVVRYEIQNALSAIETGHDVRSAIITCYRQMVEALREYRSLSRDQDMTPREFELYLQHFGLPSAPVHRLTQLFEKVRYGAQIPGPEDEQEAVASLSAIVAACRQAELTAGLE